jgi:hypothetical protein
MAMNKFSRTQSFLASGLLAAILISAPASFALAQDANAENASAQPATTVPNISGCWQGNAFNDSQGNTSILFVFAQKKNKISKKHSTFDLESAVHVHGPIAGKVKSDRFTFHGHVTGTGSNVCNIKGTGFFQMDGSLTGNYRYSGQCFEHQFTSGDFSKVIFLGPTCP